MPRTDAAVLVPVYRRAHDGALAMVFVHRSAGGLHGGQIAFPGGKPEPGDPDMWATALREAEEEIGLAPERVTRLASLPVVNALTTGFRVHPFLGKIDPPDAWRPDPREVAGVLDVGLDELTRPDAHGVEQRLEPGWDRPYEVHVIHVRGRSLWGLTYRIVAALLPRIAAGEWSV